MNKASTKSSWILVRNAAAVLLAFAGGRFAFDYLARFINIDAFSSLRPREIAGIADSVGIQLNDVSLRHYHGMKLITTSRIERVDVSKDRQSFDLYHVSNGVYHGDKGEVHFGALRANWSAINRTLNVTEQAHIWNANMNLTTATITLDQGKQQLTAPKAITGKLYEGQITANWLQYGIDSGAAEAGPVHWVGALNLLQNEADPTPRRWDISSDHLKRSKNGESEVYTNGVASDGEVIIKAPHIEREVKTDVLTATGRVLYFSSRANVSANKVVVFRKERRALLTGNVQMFLKPKKDKDRPPMIEEIPPFRPFVPSDIAAKHPVAPTPVPTAIKPNQKETEDQLRTAKNARDYPMSVKAEKIEYWYHKGERRAIITGDPQARQEFPNGAWRHIWTVEGKYNGELETLRLNSSKGKKDTRMKNSLGDDLVATWLEFSTKEDDDQYEGQDITGVVFSTDEEIPHDKTKDAPNPSPEAPTDSTPPADKPKQTPP